MQDTMKVLVTGGAGYLGSIMVPYLLSHGCDVLVLDNFIYGQSSLLDCCIDERLTVVRGDVRDTQLVTRLIKDRDVIIALAAIVGATACDRDQVAARSINFDAIKMLTGLAGKQQRVLFPATNSGYGVGEEGIHATEETPLRPVSFYGRLKVDAERVLLDAGNVVSFRLATAFGVSPRMRLDLLVNDLTHRAYHDRHIALFESHFKRNFVHVRDITRAFWFGIEHYDAMRGHPFNVGLSDANLSKLELCHKIQTHLPECEISMSDVGKDPDQRNYIVSNRKIESLGFSTRYSLDVGIKELIKSYGFLPVQRYRNA